MGTCKRIDLTILLLSVFYSAAVSNDEPQPQLKIYPEQSKVNAPSSVSYILTCSGIADTKDAFSEMTWKDPSGNVIPEETTPQSGGVRKLGSNSLKLTFFSPQSSESGVYSCSAVYMNTDSMQASVEVNFYDDIKFEQCEPQQSLILGTPGEIRCKAVGNPSPHISWSKDGQTVKSVPRYVESTEKLSISEVVEDDQGTYTVEAFVLTTGQNRYSNIEVTVQIPPKIEDLKEERIIETERYDIFCKATGYPKPTFTWFDPQSKDLSEVLGFIVNREDGTLTIERAEREYSGEYTCRAENDAGSAEKKMLLKVEVKPTIKEFTNITQRIGDDVMFVCIADGDPAPNVAIRKDNGPNFEGKEDSRIKLERSREDGKTALTLTIQQVKRTDDGLYFCSAENNAGAVEKTGHLEVQFPPNTSSTPLREVKTWSANPAKLTCIAEANPNASIIWKFQSEEIDPVIDERYSINGTISPSTLMVKLSDTASWSKVYGTYTCIARNPLGEDTVDIRLEEAMVPGQLSQVVFDQVTPTTISFRLLGPSTDGGMPVTHYVVEYKMESAESETRKDEWPKGSAYIVSNLKPRMHYKFKLAAKNAVGTGDWKEEKYVMPEETPPQTPNFVTEMEMNSDFSDRFEIAWVTPDDNGKPIRYFQIRYFKVERDGNSWKQIGKDTNIMVERWDTTSYELTNLEANTFYKVELRANNELGNSQPGLVVFRTRSGEISGEQTSMIENGIIPTAGIIAIAVVAVLIILIVMDVTCYLRYHCGLFYVMRYQTCGRSPSSEKVKDIAVEDGPECVKEISSANNGKIKNETKTPSPKATSPVQPSSDKQFDSIEEKSKSEVDNLAFDKPRLDFGNFEDKINADFPLEDTPMLSFSGGRDTRPADLIIDQNYKNKSPKGSKSSLGKSSPV